MNAFRSDLILLLILPFFFSAACDEKADRAESYSERVEPLLYGRVYPVVAKVIEKNKLIGYQLKINASLNLQDSVLCRIKVMDANNVPLPYHIFGGGIENEGDRIFSLARGQGRFPHLFLENPEEVARIMIEIGGNEILFFERGDSMDMAGNYIKPLEFHYY